MPTNEQRRKYDKAYREVNRERIRAREKAWREANIERVREAARARYARTKEAYLARQKAWREANPEKALSYARKWRRKAANECREEGVCIGCLKSDAVPGKHRCQPCLDQNRDRNARKRAAILAAIASGEHVCSRCGKENRSERRSCAKCRERSKLYTKTSLSPFCKCGQAKERGREACVSCLPDDEAALSRTAREILMALRLDGGWMSGDALAEEVGIKPNSVYVAIRRSLKEFVSERDAEQDSGGFRKEYRARR